MKSKTRWGIVGPGKIAQNFANDLLLVDDAELTAVASRNQQRAQDFASTYQIPHVFDDYDSLFESDTADVLYIATPHTFHKDLAIRAMKAGKHVLCEKPMGVNSKEVIEMIAVAKENKVFLMEALWSRFNPTIKKVKQLVDDGVLGELNYVNADFAFYALDRPMESRLFNLELAGGTLLDIGIYPIFLAYLFLGKPKQIEAVSNFNSIGTEIQTSMIFNYDGAQATLNSSFANDSAMPAGLGGTKGSIVLEPRFHETQGYTLNVGGESERVKLPTIGKGYTYEIEEVNDCIRENRMESSLWSHQDSIALISLLDAIRHKTGVRFPFEN
ncbi:Gfo/Idh/MocA family protein [Croceitalea rosinachiae]|uniref:Gfo/Idh/MocA family oxidoreductase n=1 Tax=Croceitalea rosinachiae TaxID=3075596 RepID=A0ABU3AE51_9FLAO|nr:Gfo/Idh/MocA family oxidoreductase [Croceitalea sp. F388]MDT0607378.1 Gfo/Idh/MocA family oxidoreductase [Croceitalea sp. F388]